MNPWLWASLAMLVPIILAGAASFRGGMADRLVGLELAGVMITLELVLLSEGYHRSVYFDLPLTLSFLSFGGGLVFARFLQRWL